MTLAMPDSITVPNLPSGYPAYLGYTDGDWPTVTALEAEFPNARILGYTVKGGTAVADGCDRETGDLDPAQAAAWTKGRLETGAWKPVIYASVSNMPAVLAECGDLGIGRGDVRLHSAHYGQGEHICGPRTCGQIGISMDGTQWTDTAAGLNGSLIDMSVLADGFFGDTTPPPNGWTEFDMSKLRILQTGDTDRAGEFWYVRRCQDLASLTGRINGLPLAVVTVDGVFGQKTDAAVRAVQAHARITVDGVCGPQTWSVLLTGAP